MEEREAKIQQDIVIYFHNEYPQYRGCLWAQNNGVMSPTVRDGFSDVIVKRLRGWAARTGSKMRFRGTVAGVSDLAMFIDGKSLFVEVKTPRGKQSEKQKDWQAAIEAQGGVYVLVRSLEEFKEAIKKHYQI